MSQADDDAWREAAEKALEGMEQTLHAIMELALDATDDDARDALAKIAFGVAEAIGRYGEEGTIWGDKTPSSSG
jgi:hypothetical protein